MKVIHLDKLKIPTDNLRHYSTLNANTTKDKILQSSIENLGILVPIIVNQLGHDEYSVLDGSRRINAIRNLGMPGTTKIPVQIMAYDDAKAVISQINVNQYRQSLSTFAEAEAMRILVQDHNYTQTDAAHALLKKKSWGSKVISVYNLPANMLEAFKQYKFLLGHAMILGQYNSKPKIQKALYKELLENKVSKKFLENMGARLNGRRVDEQMLSVEKIELSKYSWIKIEPLKSALRVEFHIDKEDSKKEILKQINEIIKNA